MMGVKTKKLSSLWAIVLAAGRGKRMNSINKNKVTLEVRGVPMIKRTIRLLKATGIKNILIVVGFAKESVIKLLDKDVETVEQKKRLGTAHAVGVGLKKIPENAKYTFVLNGDDSFLYKEELLKKLYNIHIENKADVTILTLEVDDPSGLGRIVRDKNGKVIAIVEDKDAKGREKQIKEINPGCYLFSVAFLRKYIGKIKKSKVTGEYYLTRIFAEEIKNSIKMETLKIKNIKWRGVNTKDDLQKAQEFFYE